jgi:NAD(P)H-hydrate epimerase
MRRLSDKPGLPYALYRAEQVRRMDAYALEIEGISAAELMARAGQALFDLARSLYPDSRRWLLLCGLGNNGGDGYVVAALAQAVGLAVEIIQLGDSQRIQGHALHHLQRAQALGVSIRQGLSGDLPPADLIVDGLFGTGLDREVSGPWRAAIEAINRHPAPVLAIDIPSGLHADSGAVLGAAVQASHSLSFIGLKPGLFTGMAADHVGQLHFSGLQVPARVYASELPSARRLDWARKIGQLPRRRATAHKGDCGHVLIIGGAPGFAGAARLAGEGALRSGAGLVSLATHPAHAACIAQQRPELMCHGLDGAEALRPLLQAADVLVLGPGLGQSDWARRLFEQAMAVDRPRLLDADGLNLLAQKPQRLARTVITPHPGEAARLLGLGSAQIQADRFAACEQLRQRYAPVVLLKGAGSLVCSDGDKAPGICSAGNAGMASGGMGDLLSGIIAGLMAQAPGLGLEPGLDWAWAAELGMVLHAEAADRAARRLSQRSLLASDLLDELPGLLREAE